MPNLKPELSFNSLKNDLVIVDNSIVANFSQDIEVEIIGKDGNGDFIVLDLLEINGANSIENYNFKASDGFGFTQSTLSLELGCQFLDENLGPETYDFIFTITDNRCPQYDADTVGLQITVNDLKLDEFNFNPTNVFTPNGDNKNEYFALDGFDELTHEVINLGLPLDNCRSQFEKIVIANRWGREVFTSNERHFKWTGKGEASGVYFYYIVYTHEEYKGTVTLLK